MMNITKTNIKWACAFAVAICFSACTKSDFLAKKPVTSIVTPHTLSDFQYLLDNTIYQGTAALAQLSDDDYFVLNDQDLDILSATERNAYVWAKDIYGGTTEIADWNTPYKNIFYSNSVLDGLAKSDSAFSARGKYLKGWALFNRAYFCYDLTRNFCKAYNKATAATDPGIPLRLSSGIDKIEQRASLQASIDRVINDLILAEDLLPAERPAANLNRPSKIAVYALLARIYLDMREYTKAEVYADKCLALYSVLIDYNSVDEFSSKPFSKTNDELIYNTCTVLSYELAATYEYAPSRILDELMATYKDNDLRKKIYFMLNTDDGYYTKKAGYYGSDYPFTGLATDEVYLIKAECLARKGEVGSAIDKLNQLLVKRMVNTVPYKPLTATTSAEALATVLSERRKELVFRGLRWFDLKRLNMEGANITLSRIVNGQAYLLPPNDPRWVFPIPNDEITLSHIQQNQR